MLDSAARSAVRLGDKIEEYARVSVLDLQIYSMIKYQKIGCIKTSGRICKISRGP